VSGTAATGGDPSPYTARGCFVGIKAAVRHKLQKDSLEGVSVAIQGLGNVGWAMAEFLHDAGAKLYVADIHENVLTKAKATFGATVIDTATIHAQDVDVFAPCALGASINPNTLPDLKAPIIAGSANNQLATPADGLALFEKGILYAPDYVINAGGVICVGSYAVAWEVAQINEKVDAIEATLDSIFAESKERHAPPEHVADAQAERLLQS
jgi:leucine dehydrogenase